MSDFLRDTYIKQYCRQIGILAKKSVSVSKQSRQDSTLMPGKGTFQLLPAGLQLPKMEAPAMPMPLPQFLRAFAALGYRGPSGLTRATLSTGSIR